MMNIAQLQSMQLVRKHTDEERRKRVAEKANPTVTQPNKISLKKTVTQKISLKKDDKEARQYVADLKRSTPKSPRKHNINYYNSEEQILPQEKLNSRNHLLGSVYIDGLIMTKWQYEQEHQRGTVGVSGHNPIPLESLYAEEQVLPNESPNFSLLFGEQSEEESKYKKDSVATTNQKLIETNSDLTEEEKELAAKVLAVNLNEHKEADDKDVVVANKTVLLASNKELVETNNELTEEEKELVAKALSASYFGYY